MPPTISKPFTTTNTPSIILTRDDMYVAFRSIAESNNGLFMPEDRMMDWTVAGSGVPANIDSRPIWKNLLEEIGGFYQCYGDNVTDDSIGIDRAMNGVLDSTAIYLPAATYRIGSSILSDYAIDNWTLRGAGIGQTILRFDNNDAFITIGSSETRPSSALTVTGGATKGSTEVTVDSASLVNIGSYIRLQPTAMLVYGHNMDAGEGATDNYSTAIFIHRVTAKTGTTVTFEPPLPLDLSSLSPLLVYYAAVPNISVGISIEDMTIDLTDSDATTALAFYNCWGWRLKNVEIKQAKHHNVTFYTCCSGLMQQCFLGDIQGVGPSHISVDLVVDNGVNRFEDNIFECENAVALLFGDALGGNWGNVILYNYAIGGAPNWDLSNNHGPHTWFNMLCGNQFGQINDDGFSGSASHNTLFRNAINAYNSGYCIVLARMHNYYSIICNVLGRIGWSGVYEITASGDSAASIFRLGYPNLGNANYTGEIAATDPPDYHLLSNNRDHADVQKRDLNVGETAHIHGNFDYYNNTTLWINDYIHIFPPCLFYTSIPSWWPGGIPWPPIGPDLTPMVSDIPAKVRYDAM